MKLSSFLIIGAGIAGLMAATALQDIASRITLLDKGRGVGGRLATRRIDSRHFDHGAQYFTCHDPRFQEWVDRWVEIGVLKIWSREFHTSGMYEFISRDPRYYAPNGMTGLAKHLAAPFDVRLGEQVIFLSHDDNEWKVETESGLVLHADAIILTPPVPQSLALLQTANLVIPEKIKRNLESISYHPCLSVMFSLPKESLIPSPGGLWMTSGGIVKWIADNQMKGISQKPSVTILTDSHYSNENYEESNEKVMMDVLHAVKPWLQGEPEHAEVKRWRYAFASTFYPKPFEIISQRPFVALAGDAFYAPRVEGAALSGLMLADAIRQQMEKG